MKNLRFWDDVYGDEINRAEDYVNLEPRCDLRNVLLYEESGGGGRREMSHENITSRKIRFRR